MQETSTATPPFTMGMVKITDTLTGEVQTSIELTGQEFSGFWWSDGNAGCDCNRSLFFMRAKVGKNTDEDWDYPCEHGEPRFRVQVLSDTGAMLFDDTRDWLNPVRAPGP